MSGTNAAWTVAACAGTAAAPAANGGPTTTWIGVGSARMACVDDGVIGPDPARAFPRSRHDRGRQGGDQLMRPLRSEVFQVCTRWRLLRVGRHHATVEDAHAVFGSVGNELLKEVVTSPLSPRT